MNNPYKTFSLKDLIPIIDRVAMDNMLEPVFTQKKPDGLMATLAEVSNHNSLSAMFNDGIRTMALRLEEELDRDD